MQNKLSVIIPVYNVEKYLHKCMDSIINQTFPDMEIIVIDDGSPDNCGTICDCYAQKDSRIRVIHKRNEGLCAARNDGIKNATGQWITFVDADDWCELDYYKKVFESSNYMDADVLFAGGHFLEHGKKCEIKRNFKKSFSFDSKEKMKLLMADVLAPGCKIDEGECYNSAAAPWDKIYRTDFIKKNALYFDMSSKAWEDVWYNLQVFGTAQKVVGCTYIGYHYRVVNESITKRFNPNKVSINYDFLQKTNAYIMTKGDRDILQKAEYARTILLFIHLLKVYYFNSANDNKYSKTVKEISELKNIDYYYNAIHSKSNEFLLKKQIIIKYLLRRKSIFPIFLIYKLNQIITEAKK